MAQVSSLKSALCKYMILGTALLLGGCSTNPATGEQQFTGLLPAGQEASIGASEHEKVQQTYGQFITDPIAEYVNRIGQKVASGTERSDVQYKFYVIDSPIVNAFALPGGYIYVSRGLLALANSEAEMAAVIAHEIGHVTARHAAERMSHGVLAGLGAAVLSAATGSSAVGQIANVGSDLYIKSYSRGQETQSDELGVRYLAQAGYDPAAMASFLRSLDAQTKLDQQISGQSEGAGFNYFSTHPVTADRVTHASALAVNHGGGAKVQNRDVYLSMINGLTYGDSEAQGFVRGNNFYHPKMGFTFTVPQGFEIQNNPNELIAAGKDGSIIILDAGRDDQGRDPLRYLTENWMKNKPSSAQAENITINGMRAATAAFAGSANGKPVIIRVVAIEWKPGQFFRFQMAIPQAAGTQAVEDMKRATYSFRQMNDAERASIHALKIRTFTAGGEGVAQAAARMAFPSYKEERFRVLNGIGGGPLTSGQIYKVVTE